MKEIKSQKQTALTKQNVYFCKKGKRKVAVEVVNSRADDFFLKKY